jgi:nicotinate-nucleotide adenylyltransferase
MSTRPRVGVLGGMFDPIHLGHVAAAIAAGNVLALDTLRIVPAAQPPHRDAMPVASAYHRLEMIRLAIAERSLAGGTATPWTICDVELRRGGLSYTFDTLATLHAEGMSPLQIFFITGADAFAEIATWHRYPEVLDTAHFVVVARPGASLDALPERLRALASRMIRPPAVDHATVPRIILIEAATPAVSSTAIRRRVSRGESLDGLVTPSVAAYISQHSLYRMAPDAPIALGV